MANLIYHGLKSNLPSNREPNSFYLTTDTRELYFGAELYTEPVRFYAGTKPQSPAQGVLYINETTGAGDVYHGAFDTAYLNGMDVVSAARYATGVSSIKCTQMGGRAGIPDSETLEKFLATGRIDYEKINRRAERYRRGV